MTFTEEYKQKLVSAEKAVSVIKSGDWIDYGWTTCAPMPLIRHSPPVRRT